MRWGTRRMCLALTGGVAIGWTTLRCTVRGGSTDGSSLHRLSAEEFNALQDRPMLAEAFGITHLPWNSNYQQNKKHHEGRDFSLTLYRLLGCPYCAKVEWVLRYYRVAFNIVDVDTLSGAEIPDPRYPLVPQILLAPIDDVCKTVAPHESKGVYVVDSQRIISALSVPLGFNKQLQSPRVLDTCQWITERFQAVSFAVTNSTWLNAFASYPCVTPPWYHNIVFRVVGASALWILSRYMVYPRLVEQRSIEAAAAPPKDPAAWLEEELTAFVSRIQDYPRQRFHGGKEPDIADVEMYAVTRVIDAHPRLRHILHQGSFGGWNAAMDLEVRKREQVKL